MISTNLFLVYILYEYYIKIILFFEYNFIQKKYNLNIIDINF